MNTTLPIPAMSLRYLSSLNIRLREILQQLRSESPQKMNGVVYVDSFAIADLPTADKAGGVIYISDESGGAVLAFSDGTNWRRVTDRAVAS